MYHVPVIWAIGANSYHWIVLSEGTNTPTNGNLDMIRYGLTWANLVPPGISILEKLHSEEKYLGRNEAEAKLDCSCLFLVPWK